MSQVVSTPQQICNSPLNSSTAKMLFTFPKAERQSMAEKTGGAHIFYDLPPVRDTRAAGFGYGSKYDFTKGGSKNPAPNAYTVAAPIESPKKKGFSFGLSRESMASTGTFAIGTKNSPGPAAYDTRETNKTSISFSIRPRTKSIENQFTKSVPGPGAYPTFETITPKGKVFVSKYNSASTTVFSPAIQKRFDVGKQADKPGPGAYPLVGEINNTGSYFVSKFKSSVGKTFGLSLKKPGSGDSFKDKMPGPGAYRLPSDFGYYEAKSATNKATLETTA